MFISNIVLKNWRNFTHVDVRLQQRQFIVGPNASGKSNFLDAFRFLRDIAKQKGGGLQEAIDKRGGLSKIRCLSARQDTEVLICISISDSIDDELPKWRYEIGIKQESRGYRQPYVSSEKVWNSEDVRIINRPDKDDKDDEERRKQTYLEQVNNNREFREIQQYLQKITYMHLVPQLLRHSDDIQGRLLEDDPFGQGLLENIAKTNVNTQRSRLKKMTNVVKSAVPKLEDLKFERDKDSGRPHLTAKYTHWRSHDAHQREDQFSDGTLRLMGLIWSLLDGDSLLLLEEPELSLHAGIVERLASLFHRAQMQQKKKMRQIFVSTHSADLLSDKGIGAEDVLLLEPTNEGTKVIVSSELSDITTLLLADIAIGEAVIAHTKSKDIGKIQRQLK